LPVLGRSRLLRSSSLTSLSELTVHFSSFCFVLSFKCNTSVNTSASLARINFRLRTLWYPLTPVLCQCLDLGFHHLGNFLCIVLLLQHSRGVHGLSHFCRIVHPNGELKLNCLILFMSWFVFLQLFAVSHPQSEHNLVLVRLDQLLSFTELHLEPHILCKEVLPQQLLDAWSVLLPQLDALLNDFFHILAFNLLQAVWLHTVDNLFVDLGGPSALTVWVLTGGHLQHTESIGVHIHCLVIVFLIHFRSHELWRPNHTFGKGFVLKGG